jgi:hypothetical protein
MSSPPLTPAQLTRHVRASLRSHVFDETAADASGTAIYTLADPRDVRCSRYVGQTRAPRRRYLQHVSTARLWLPDETPWWIRNVAHRPLYEWIRSLHREERRLPVMVVDAWVGSAADALTAERESIQRCLRQGLPLLNVAWGDLHPQYPLL